jgi:hypothetical protein
MPGKCRGNSTALLPMTPVAGVPPFPSGETQASLYFNGKAPGYEQQHLPTNIQNGLWVVSSLRL